MNHFERNDNKINNLKDAQFIPASNPNHTINYFQNPNLPFTSTNNMSLHSSIGDVHKPRHRLDPMNLTKQQIQYNETINSPITVWNKQINNNAWKHNDSSQQMSRIVCLDNRDTGVI